MLSARWSAGRNKGLPHAVVLARETARVSPSFSIALSLHNEVFLAALGSHARTQEQLNLRSAALRGDVIGCVAVTEPSGGSDILAVQCEAKHHNDGWQIAGSKRYISNAGTATHCLLLAQVAGRPTAFVVPIRSVNVVGFFNKLGVGACDLAALEFDVWVPEDAVIGAVGAGHVVVLRGLEFERIAASAALIEIGRQAFRLTVAYARDRRQFGRRLIEHQALAHRLADCYSVLASAEALLTSSVVKAEAGRSVLLESAVLKLHVARSIGTLVDECMQVFGARGYTTNFPIEAWWRDVRLARLGAGTDEIMREMIASHLDMADAEANEYLAQLLNADQPKLDDWDPNA